MNASCPHGIVYYDVQLNEGGRSNFYVWGKIFLESYWAFEVYSCRVKFITMYKVVQTLSLWLKSFSWKPKGVIPFAFVLRLFIIARMKLKLLETNTLY